MQSTIWIKKHWRKEQNMRSDRNIENDQIKKPEGHTAKRNKTRGHKYARTQYIQTNNKKMGSRSKPVPHKLYYWQYYFSNVATTSISTRAPLGRVLTATAERAGNGSLKNVA